MSRRFGRNQRRRAREAVQTLSASVANLNEALVMDRGLLRHTSDKLRELQQQIDDAKEIAGNMSVLFPVSTMDMSTQKRRGGPIEVAVAGPFEFESVDRAPSAGILRRISLDTLVASIERSTLQESLHVRVEFANKEFVYGISRSAWMQMSSAKRFDLIQRQLPAMFARQISQIGFQS
jgi:hypothetical protein